MSPKLPCYRLRDVKKLVHDAKWSVNVDAGIDAFNYFGWKSDEIKRALIRLSGAAFYKTEYHKQFYPVTVDVYKIKDFYGENVYIHFYIRPKDGWLIINSCHNLY